MLCTIRCWNCTTQNRVDTFKITRPDGIVRCGKCHKPFAKLRGTPFFHRGIRAYRPPKPRGICGCCGQDPSKFGDKLFQGFCPECWANTDGMGRPPRRF